MALAAVKGKGTDRVKALGQLRLVAPIAGSVRWIHLTSAGARRV